MVKGSSKRSGSARRGRRTGSAKRSPVRGYWFESTSNEWYS